MNDQRQTAPNVPNESTPAWATNRLAQEFKDILTRLGAFLPRIFIQCLESSLHYLEGGRWMRVHGFKNFKRVSRPSEIFQLVADQTRGIKLLYLEFGVHEGRSIAAFAKMVSNADATFHGFDSFIGLPERWNVFNKRGHFSTDGKAPEVQDKRISFFKGWFSESLPKYKLPPNDQLFINIDCDLYSSASYVLMHLMPQIRPGTYLYFDEFYDRHQEMKAFEEFLELSGFRFECIMSTKGLANVLFRRIS